MSQLEKLKEVQNKVRETLQQAKEMAKGAFEEGCSALFEQFPNLVGFSWTQYTPYFNDGDTCTFGCHASDPNIWFKDDLSQDDEEDFDEDGAYFSEYDYEDKTDPKCLAGMAVVEFLTAFDDELMLSMFDDHCKVTVTRNGVDVEEYSHD